MNEQKYIASIGLEIHAELKTRSKMFCRCINNPDEEKINIHVCPTCLAHPGTLPVLNREAISHVLKIGTALGGQIADFTEWDRKNYFYPDIPKGYQISQYAYPLVSGGTLSNIKLERIHLEEDTAQSTHDKHEHSLINFNRAGVPLMELVTTPTIHDAETAVTFAKELQLLLRYLGAGEANMEKGEMRVEANISVSPIGSKTLGTKTEVKNLNSFRSVEKSINYEIERHINLLENGEKVIQETRGWDDAKGETYSQRKKESSHDYRYFPDPDIPKLKISEIPEFSKEKLLASLPELPWIKRDRYKKDYAMTDKEVAVFINDPRIAKFFEQVIRPFKDDSIRVKLAINYLLSHYIKYIETQIMRPILFSEVINLLAENKISSSRAKSLIDLLQKIPNATTSWPHLLASLSEKSAEITVNLNVESIAKENNLLQQSDTSSLIPAIEKVITDNPGVVTEYKGGKVASLQFLIGQAMKATKGSGNPEIVKKILLEKLG